MSPRGSAPESVLEEIPLADAAFGENGQPQRKITPRFRLTRPHVTVPLANIAAGAPYQSRLVTFDPVQYPEDAELLESVKTHGVLEPVYLEQLTTRMGERPSYRAVAGHRRLAAARLVGHEHIEAIIAREEDDVRAVALAENLGHRKLTAYEKALSLMAVKSNHPEMTLRELAKRSGIPFGTVANLIDAYEKSTPVLRRVFSEGVAPRAVQELQPVFNALPEEDQVKLAEDLLGITQPRAAALRRMVAGGIDPAAAAKSIMGYAGSSSSQDRDTIPTGPSNGRPHKVKANTKPQGTPHTHQPDNIGDLQALSSRTGAPLPIVRRLAKKAGKVDADYAALCMACTYAAHGGDELGALKLAVTASGSRSIRSAVLRYLEVLERAKALITASEEDSIASFLQTIFFGA